MSAKKMTPSECLIIGCPDTGKSFLVQRLKHTNMTRGTQDSFVPTETHPTSGQEVDYLPGKRKTVCLREVGGMLSSLWPSYLDTADKVMFVVDLGNPPQLGQSTAKLYELCQQKDMYDKRLLLVLNKVESPHRMTRDFVMEEMRLGDLQQLGCLKHTIKVAETSNLRGDNTKAICDWLMS